MPSLSRRAAAAAFAALLLALSAPVFASGRRPKLRPQPKKRYILVFREGTSAEEKRQTCAQLGLKELEDLRFLNIVVAEETDQAQPDSVDRARGNDQIEGVEEDFYVNWIKKAEPTLSDAFQSAAVFAKSTRDDLAARAPRRAPEDLAPSQPNLPWGVVRVGAPQAWNSRAPATMGAGVKVAVVDTGVDCSHPDLQCDLSSGYNAIDEQADPDDDNGHGTHVAGTIAGHGKAAPDGTLVYGVAPLATIIPVKVLDKDGGGALSDVVRGINWAAESGAQIISMSLGSPKGSSTLQRAVQTAYQRGVTIVAAAGNSGPGDGTVGYPGKYPESIAVAASDRNDQIADFSSRGPQVAFTAPGVDILSTWPGGGYKTLSGTSMAAPHMTGLAALAIAAGARGADSVRQALAGASSRLCDNTSCPPQTAQGGGMPDAGKLARGGGGVFASLGATGNGGR